MDIFIVLFTAIVSWVFTYVKTYIVRFKYVHLLDINQTSIKLFLKYLTIYSDKKKKRMRGSQELEIGGGNYCKGTGGNLGVEKKFRIISIMIFK